MVWEFLLVAYLTSPPQYLNGFELFMRTLLKTTTNPPPTTITFFQKKMGQTGSFLLHFLFLCY
jgi:hypothetical protein